MRLISQDGRYDIPYDMSPLYVFKSCDEWQVRTVDTMLGHYSTEEKALKVMEMVRDRYEKCVQVSSPGKFYFAYNNPKVFQFPKDEEVEV